MEPLKEMFNLSYYKLLAKTISSVYPVFEGDKFITIVTKDLASRSLNERLRHTSQTIHAFLPHTFPDALAVLEKAATKMPTGYTALVFPDYVGLFGKDHFERSMEALKYFTVFGSSEFAVREFLKHDHKKALAIMLKWSKDKNEHVRRLASEGSRPRLPWSFKLPYMIEDPSYTADILNNLKADPSIYVRKSVANHLNDISKDNSDFMLTTVSEWDLSNPHTAWIVKHASRTLVKKGDKRSLSVFKYEKSPKIEVRAFKFVNKTIKLGEKLQFSFEIHSLKKSPQKLVVDYQVHYPKANGKLSAKVFKLKDLELGAGTVSKISTSQLFKDFTTRKHFSGKHILEIQINGEIYHSSNFELKTY